MFTLLVVVTVLIVLGPWTLDLERITRPRWARKCNGEPILAIWRRAILVDPIFLDAQHILVEFSRRYGFHEVSVGSETVRPLHVAILIRRGMDEDRKPG